jgi:hypothetical protein
MMDEHTMKSKELVYKFQNYDNIAKDIKAQFINKKNRWKKAAAKAPTLYQFLKDNIYNED